MARQPRPPGRPLAQRLLDSGPCITGRETVRRRKRQGETHDAKAHERAYPQNVNEPGIPARRRWPRTRAGGRLPPKVSIANEPLSLRTLIASCFSMSVETLRSGKWLHHGPYRRRRHHRQHRLFLERQRGPPASRLARAPALLPGDRGAGFIRGGRRAPSLGQPGGRGRRRDGRGFAHRDLEETVTGPAPEPTGAEDAPTGADTGAGRSLDALDPVLQRPLRGCPHTYN